MVTVPGLGDNIQALKAGLLEVADLLVVNKSDREGADRTKLMRKFDQVMSNPRIRDIRKIAELSAEDLQTMTTRGDVEFRKAEVRLFSTEGASGNDGPWPQLSPEYAARKRRMYGRKKIMQRTGWLRKSLVSTGGDDVATYTLRPPSIAFGTQVEVAAYHIQRPGNRLANPRLPHRDTLSTSDDDERRIRQKFYDFMIVKLRRVESVLVAGAREMVARGWLRPGGG